MKKIIIFVIFLIVVISAICSLDYNRVKNNEMPIFTFQMKEYKYAGGSVYEYVGTLYKIVDAREISDFENVMLSTMFEKTKSFDISASDNIDMRGNISNKQLDGSLYIEKNTIPQTGYTDCWIDIDKSTIIFNNVTKKIVTKESIPDNAIIEVAFREVNKEKTPIRGVAKFIVIL